MVGTAAWLIACVGLGAGAGATVDRMIVEADEVDAIPRCDGPQRCEKKCRGGDHGACVSTAVQLLAEPRRSKQALADELLALGCDGNEAAACHRYGVRLFEQNRHRDAVKALRRACTRGLQASCYNLAMMQVNGWGMPRSSAGYDAFATSCHRGYWPSCAYRVGGGRSTALRTDPPERPNDEVIEQCERAEEYGGDDPGKRRLRVRVCASAAPLYEHGVGVSTDRDRAAKAYRAACAVGERQACFNLGLMHERAGDIPAAIAALQPLCPGEAVACERLNALFAANGPASKAGATKPTRHNLEVTCERGMGEACIQLAESYDRPGADVTSLKSAFGYYRRACLWPDSKTRSGGACVRLGQMAENGLIGPPDYELALKAYVTGCGSESAAGCTGVGRIYETGRGLSRRQPFAAFGFYRRGCVGGDAAGCSGAGRARRTLLVAAGPAADLPVGRRCEESTELYDCLLRPGWRDQLSLEEAFLIASGASTRADLNHHLVELEALTRIVAHRAREQGGTDVERGKEILNALHVGFLFDYAPQLSDVRRTLKTGTYNCLTATVLYVLAAKRAGLVVGAYAMRGHVMALLFSTKGPRWVESTTPRYGPQVEPPKWADPLFALLVSITGGDTEKDETAHDVSADALVSLVFWNRTLVAAEQGRVAEAARSAAGLFHLAHERDKEQMWRILAAELRSFVFALAEAEGWPAAADFIDRIGAVVEARGGSTHLRDTRAATYVAWAREAASPAEACTAFARLLRVDPSHPAVAHLRKDLTCAP